MRKFIAFVFFVFVLGICSAAHAQLPSGVSGISTAPPGSTAILTPTQLGVNALTEPGSSTSALSSIIDTRGVRELTLMYSCTQGAITINVQTYADDGSTTLALVSPISAVAAATNATLHLGSEVNPTGNTGTISGTAVLRLPARAVAFSFTNASATPGTCTARLYLQF